MPMIASFTVSQAEVECEPEQLSIGRPAGVFMYVGVPRQIKESENRLAILPVGVDTLKRAGHRVLIEKGAGDGSGISDEDFRHAGAEIVASARDVWERAE